MNLSRVTVLVVFLGILAMATHVSIDSDTWWHLRAGQWMLENQQIIREDVFSYTSLGKPWQYPGLWVQVLMFGIYDWFGPGGLNLWVSLSVVSIFAIVWKSMEGNDLFKAAILMLAAISSAIYWAARPYLVSYLLFAIYFYLLERFYREDKGKLWLLPILMVVWVNSHGGFLAGFILWGPYFVQSAADWLLAKRNNQQDQVPIYQKKLLHFIWIGLAMLVGTLVNPQGINLWSLPFTTVSRQAEQLFIAEWQSPDFHNPTLLPFAWMLVISLVFLGGAKKRLKGYELLLMAGFGLLGLISIRNIFFFVIVAPAILSRSGRNLFEELGKDFKIRLELDFSKPPGRLGSGLNIILVLIVGFVAVVRVVSFLPESVNQDEFSSQFPTAAVDFIQSENLQGRMFNTYNYGGYLIWTLPEYPVFVDGRADLHQDEIIMTWYRVINGSDEWEQVFAEWDIHLVLVEPGAPLLSQLKESGWRLVYQDDLAVVAVSQDQSTMKD